MIATPLSPDERERLRAEATAEQDHPDERHATWQRLVLRLLATVDEAPLAAAAQAVLTATDALTDARNGLGHPGAPHDRAIHMDPCCAGHPDVHVYSDSTDCAACGGATYGTEDALNHAIGDLRAALGQPKRPWETRTQAEWETAIAIVRSGAS